MFSTPKTRPYGFLIIKLFTLLLAFGPQAYGQKEASKPEAEAVSSISSHSLSQPSILSRAWEGGPIVFMVLIILIALSISTWSVAISKFLHLSRSEKASQKFIASFWESRSLNDLNSRLGEYPACPVREVFRTGYAEVVRGSQLRESHKEPKEVGSNLFFTRPLRILQEHYRKPKC